MNPIQGTGLFARMLIVCFCLMGCAPKIKPFLWLTGTWEMQPIAGSTRYEIWSQKDNESLSGRGFRISGPDTTILETIELVYKDHQFSYIPTVPDQNNSLPIEFKSKKMEGNHFIFENPYHDFPQRIIYRYKPSGLQPTHNPSPGDSLLVRVESLTGNGIDYGFKRN